MMITFGIRGVFTLGKFFDPLVWSRTKANFLFFLAVCIHIVLRGQSTPPLDRNGGGRTEPRPTFCYCF